VKYITIIFATLLAVTYCAASKQANNETISDKTIPIEQIDKELAELLSVVDKNSGQYGVLDHARAFARRLEHYLLYPQTLENDMPLLRKMMSISEFPISGHKEYSFSWYEGGTMGYNYNTYIQYRNENGDIAFVPFLNDLRYPSSFNLQEFCYDNTIYYLVEQYSRGMSCSWYYYIAVISIKDGAIRYHPEFFPAEFDFKPGLEEYFIYDENGEIIDNKERPCYFMRVCGTENANTNVGFTFDPDTLTITVLDDADTTESRTGATTKSEWKLNTNFDANDRGELRESIAGDFNGDGKKEVAELYYKFAGEGGVDDDPIYTWTDDNYDVYFSDDAVKTLDSSVIQWGAANMTNEGDLNGDGADEIGLWIFGGYSSCGTYVVFTYCEEGWKDLVAIDHNPNWNTRDYQQLVRKHPTNPNWLIVDEVIFDDGRIRERIIDIRYVDTRKFRYERINLAVDNYVYIEGWWREADGFSGYYDVGLRMSHCEGEPLSFYAGRISDLSRFRDDRVKYEHDDNATFATAPDDLFFFADIDFDGACELITGITPFAGSQRNCPAFTTIYKLVNGRYKDVSNLFRTKSKIFEAIEPHNFSINYARKEIIIHKDVGTLGGDWEVYTYKNREYVYDRHINFNRGIEDDIVTLTIDYADNTPQKSWQVSSYDFIRQREHIIFSLINNNYEQ
jgi:hypothetical protein